MGQGGQVGHGIPRALQIPHHSHDIKRELAASSNDTISRIMRADGIPMYISG